MARKKAARKRDGKAKKIGGASTAATHERQSPHPAKKPLTLEQLRSLSKRLSAWKKISRSADFSSYDAITAEAAAALARYCFDLDLSGVKTVSPDIIRALNAKSWEGKASSWHACDLNLSGVESLSDECAAALADRFKQCPFPAGILKLNGLQEISDSAAKELTSYPGEIHLEKVRRLSVNAAASLAGRLTTTHVSLKLWPASAAKVFRTHVTTLTAERLHSTHSDNLPDLTRYTLLTDEAAAVLSKAKNAYITLGVTAITDAAAESLGSSRANLSLDSLSTLSDAAAASFGNHRQILSLDGLKSLSDSAAIALGRHHGTLSLNGLRTLSDAAAEGLRHNRGALHLNGVTRLSDSAASSLGRHKGMLWLNAVRTLTDNAAAAIAMHEQGNLENDHLELSLMGLRKVSVSVAERLAMHRGSLALDVDQMSPQSLEAIVAHPALELTHASAATKKTLVTLKRKRPRPGQASFPALASARQAGASLLRSVWNGFGDDGCFEHTLFKQGRPFKAAVNPTSDVEQIISEHDLVVDGIMNGSVGILEIDMVHGHAVFWDAQQADETERFAEFLLRCEWAAVAKVEASLVTQCVSAKENDGEAPSVNVTVSGVKTVPAGLGREFTALLRMMVYRVSHLEGCDDLLLRVAETCGRRVRMNIDVPARTVVFAGGGKTLTTKIPVRTLAVTKFKVAV